MNLFHFKTSSFYLKKNEKYKILSYAIAITHYKQASIVGEIFLSHNYIFPQPSSSSAGERQWESNLPE